MKTIDINIDCNDLLADISQNAYIEGVKLGDDNYRQRYITQGVLDEGSRTIVIREIGYAWKEIVTASAAYTTPQDAVAETEHTNEYSATELRDIINRGGQLTMRLYCPDSVPYQYADVATERLHAYLVARATERWLLRVLPAAAEVYSAEATLARTRYIEGLHDRRKNIRITTYPL